MPLTSTSHAFKFEIITGDVFCRLIHNYASFSICGMWCSIVCVHEALGGKWFCSGAANTALSWGLSVKKTLLDICRKWALLCHGYWPLQVYFFLITCRLSAALRKDTFSIFKKDKHAFHKHLNVSCGFDQFVLVFLSVRSQVNVAVVVASEFEVGQAVSKVELRHSPERFTVSKQLQSPVTYSR